MHWSGMGPYALPVLTVLLIASSVSSFTFLSRQRNHFPRRGLFNRLRMSSIDSVTVPVKDVTAASTLYSNALGLPEVVEGDASCITLSGESTLHLRKACGSEADPYELGDGFVGIGIVKSKDEAAVALAAVPNCGGAVLGDGMGDFEYGASLIPDEDEMKKYPVRYAKIIDTDGYCVEIKEEKYGSDIASACVAVKTAAKFVLNVVQFDETIAFYRDVLGMNLLRRRANIFSVPREASMVAYMGYGSETNGAYLELVYRYSSELIDHGTQGGAAISLIVDNLGMVVAQLTAKQVKFAMEEDGSISTSDPSGYTIYLRAASI